MMASKDADAPIPFTITVKGAGETMVASDEFSFDANMEKMYLTITSDDKIIEGKRL